MDELQNTQQKSIDWANEVGITQMISATLGQGNRGVNPTLDEVKQAADEYNKIAAIAAKAGMQQGLHNEGFELAMVDGKRIYDLLFDLLDPKLVKFQFQMSTITSGLVAADYFTKYPDRFIFHAFAGHRHERTGRGASSKGAKAGTTRIATPSSGLWERQLDWVKTFTAGRSAGSKNYFVERPGN